MDHGRYKAVICSKGSITSVMSPVIPLVTTKHMHNHECYSYHRHNHGRDGDLLLAIPSYITGVISRQRLMMNFLSLFCKFYILYTYISYSLAWVLHCLSMFLHFPQVKTHKTYMIHIYTPAHI